MVLLPGNFPEKEMCGNFKVAYRGQTFFDHALWHGYLISPTQYRTCVPCNRSMESSLLDCQGKHQRLFIFHYDLSQDIEYVPYAPQWDLVVYPFCVLLCLVAWLCPTLCNPLNCSPPGSSVHGISQARILEWVAISFSRGSSWPRDRTSITCVFYIEGRVLTH